MTPDDNAPLTWKSFPGFYSHPVIHSLASRKRWTVSNADKVPVDMRHLLETGQVRGAYSPDENCLVDLPAILSAIPNIANHAYYLDAQVDGYMVLDIEKTCPPEVADRLLKLPFLYGELSMSGRGFHLVFELPANMHEYPIAAGKRVLKEEHGYYEILIEHYVTLTRKAISPERIQQALTSPGAAPSWEEVYAELAENAVESVSVDMDIDEVKPEIPYEETILSLITRFPYARELEDFHHDHSRYEYGMLGYYYNKLRPVIEETSFAHAHTYTEAERAWLIYEAAKSQLEWRPKHDELRNGLPVLLNAATSVVAHRLADEAEKHSRRQ